MQAKGLLEQLANTDILNLPKNTRNDAIRDLEKVVVTWKARNMMSDVFNRISPNFECFPRAPLGRLTAFIRIVYTSGAEQGSTLQSVARLTASRITAFRELGTVELIICGLTLTTKSISRLDSGLLAEIFCQAKGIALQATPILMADKDIAVAVQDAEVEEFTKSKSSQVNDEDIFSLYGTRISGSSPTPCAPYTFPPRSKVLGVFNIAGR